MAYHMEESLLAELNAVKRINANLDLDAGAIEGLKKMPVDMFDGAYLGEAYDNALVLCVDVRNFSDFLCSQDEDTVFLLIETFTSNLLSCINQCGYGCSYYKLLGDGALMIWDETTEQAISEALDIFDSYTSFLDEDLFKPFKKLGLGLGGALVQEKVFKYEISAEVSQLKYRDYVGYGINLSCRLQALARSNELVLNKMLVKSGLIPFRHNKSLKLIDDLHSLKGLKEDDRNFLLYYSKDTAQA
jgi:class 3 adenylate cyclase